MLADQAAYATATRQARLLNINAYINRTQIANQLAIAQGVQVPGLNMLLKLQQILVRLPSFSRLFQQFLQILVVV